MRRKQDMSIERKKGRRSDSSSSKLKKKISKTKRALNLYMSFCTV